MDEKIKVETVSKEIHRANRYLAHMYIKLEMAYEEGLKKSDFTRYFELANVLMSSSRTFWVLVIHKMAPFWYYSIPKASLIKVIDNVRKTIAKKKVSPFTISRRYILKRNGKWRPIGAPDFRTKMIHKGLDMVLRIGLEKHVPDWQHGFMPGRSVATATYHLITRLRIPQSYVHEFDLKSCFNRINLRSFFETPLLGGQRDRAWERFAQWLVPLLICNPPYCPGEFKKVDREVHQNEARTFYTYIGLPQGSPISPLLAIVAIGFSSMNYLAKQGWLTMYADDGIIVSHRKLDLSKYLESDKIVTGFGGFTEFHSNIASEWQQHPEQFGAILADDKPHGETKKFKFLGIYYSLWGGSKIAWKNNPDGTQTRIDILKADDDEIRKFSQLATPYSESKLERLQHWSWDITKDSYLGSRFLPYNMVLGPSIGMVIVWIMRKLGLYFKPLQRWLNRSMMKDPFGASTACTVDLLNDVLPLKRPDITRWKSLKPGYISPRTYFPEFPKIRGKDGRTFIRGDHLYYEE